MAASSAYIMCHLQQIFAPTTVSKKDVQAKMLTPQAGSEQKNCFTWTNIHHYSFYERPASTQKSNRPHSQASLAAWWPDGLAWKTTTIASSLNVESPLFERRRANLEEPVTLLRPLTDCRAGRYAGWCFHITQPVNGGAAINFAKKCESLLVRSFSFAADRISGRVRRCKRRSGVVGRASGGWFLCLFCVDPVGCLGSWRSHQIVCYYERYVLVSVLFFWMSCLVQ